MPSFVWIQNVVFPILGMGMGTFALYGVYRTVNKWMDRRHERLLASVDGPGGRQAIDELERRVEYLEDTAARVQELEERLDFAERVLAQQDHRRLESGG